MVCSISLLWSSSKFPLDLIDVLDLSHLSDLRVLRLEGLRISKTHMEEFLPEILKRLESPFLESIEIKFRLECEAGAECVNWSRLERVLLGLHFFGLRSVQITGEAHSGSAEQVEGWIYGGMPDLRERGVLGVRVANEKVETLWMEDGKFRAMILFRACTIETSSL